MAGKRIGELPKQSEFQMTDLLLVEQGGVTRHATIEDLRKIMKGDQGLPGGGARIDDNSVREDATWSSNKISQHVSTHMSEVKGTNISATGTVVAPISDLVILGNTVQNPNNLADIKSVGNAQSDGRYRFGIVSCGKNLFDGVIEMGTIGSDTGLDVNVSSEVRSKNYTRIPKSKNLVISYDLDHNAGIRYYDSKYKYIGYQGVSNGQPLTVPSNAEYVRFKFMTTNTNIRVMLEEGTTSTSYQLYSEDRTSVLLPCQIEKVGTSEDRLYYNSDSKSWCIDKNTVDTVLDGNELGWKLYIPSDAANVNTICFEIGKPNKFSNPDDKSLNIMSSVLPTITAGDSYSRDIEGVADRYDLIRVKVNRTKLATPDVSGFKNWLSKNNMLVKYQSSVTQKIVLPKDVQIVLNSFLDVTNIYTIDTEVEPTILCKVSKSLGDSVQNTLSAVNVLSDRVTEIEGLKESQVMNYASSKGYFVCTNTKKGIINNLLLQGKTLINYGRRVTDRQVVQYNSVMSVTQPLKPLTEYKLRIRNRGSIEIKVYRNENLFTNGGTYVVTPGSSVEATLMTGTTTVGAFQEPLLKSNTEGTVSFSLDVLLMESSMYDASIPFFEGVATVGTGSDTIQVSANNGNLLPKGYKDGWGFCSHQNMSVAATSDSSIIISNKSTTIVDSYTINRIKLDDCVIDGELIIGFDVTGADSAKTTIYLLSYDDEGNRYYAVSNRSVLAEGYNEISFKGLTKKNLALRFNNDAPNNVLSIKNLAIKVKPNANFVEPTGMSRTLMYRDKITKEWLPIPYLSELDYIDTATNRWIKRSGIMALSGGSGENYSAPVAPNMVKTKVFQVLGKKYASRSKIVCDYHPYTTIDMWTKDEPSVWVNSDGIMYFRVLLSELATPDVDGFKKWLADKNKSIVYQLPVEEVYEALPVTLDCYEGETYLQSGSNGCVRPILRWSLSSYVTNIVADTVKRIKTLETEVFGMFKSVLAGDYRSVASGLYPQDFTSGGQPTTK